MTITADARRALDRIDGETLIARAVEWCAVNSGSRDLPGLARMQTRLAAELARLPGEPQTLALGPVEEVGPDARSREVGSGAALRLVVRPSAPIQVALTGHYDTVYPAGSPFAAVRVREDGALNGPGIADMKGGLSVMLGALAAFETHPAARGVGWTVLISPDEETGSLASASLLAELGARAHLHLTYEPAMDAAGTLAAARKGSGNYALAVRGRAAHAGRDFAAGRNAVAAACRLAARLDDLNGRRDGVTLNVARIDGGGALNTVPDAAVVRFNARLPDAPARGWLEGELQRLSRSPQPDGVTVELHGAVTRPPKPFSPVQARLFQAARTTAARLGQVLEWKDSGGVCEGNNLYAAGCPGIDTLGVCGGAIHSEAEHAWPASFAERARLSTLLLIEIATGAIDAVGLRRALAS